MDLSIPLSRPTHNPLFWPERGKVTAPRHWHSHFGVGWEQHALRKKLWEPEPFQDVERLQIGNEEDPDAEVPENGVSKDKKSLWGTNSLDITLASSWLARGKGTQEINGLLKRNIKCPLASLCFPPPPKP